VSEPSPRADSPRSRLLRRALGVAIAVAVVSLQFTPLRDLFAPGRLQQAQASIQALGPGAPLAFLALCTVGIGLGLPRLGFAALGGIAFGWLVGTVLAQIGTVAGCLVSFSWARYLAKDLPLRGGRFQAVLERIARRPIASQVGLRLVPVGHTLALNSLLALCPISTRDFLVGAALGTFPETLAFALFGAGAVDGSGRAIAVGATVMLVLIAGTFLLARRLRFGWEVP
jgi:uncharacterized membrane protein YdjX (TVP38/TMEM64 family)